RRGPDRLRASRLSRPQPHDRASNQRDRASAERPFRRSTGDRMPARRTLLYLAHDFPLPVSSAARLRTYNWILHFSKHFEVTFVAPARGVPEPAYVEALEPYCAEVVAPRLEEGSFASSPLRGGLSLRALSRRVRAELRWLMRASPSEAWYLQHGEPRAALASVSRARETYVVFAERWTWGRKALATGSRLVLDTAALQANRFEASL